MAKILVEDRRKVGSRVLVKKLHHVLSHDVFVFEMLEVSVDQIEPARVVIDHAAQRVEEERTLGILVSRRSGIDIAWRNNRPLILNMRLRGIYVLHGIGLAPPVFDVEGFKIVRPTLVNPHIGAIGGADRVAEPFVAAFVDDDEVEPLTYFIPTPEISVGKAIAVGNGGLVFHPRIRHLDQFVAVFLKRVLTEIMRISLDHALSLIEAYTHYLGGRRII